MNAIVIDPNKDLWPFVRRIMVYPSVYIINIMDDFGVDIDMAELYYPLARDSKYSSWLVQFEKDMDLVTISVPVMPRSNAYNHWLSIVELHTKGGVTLRNAYDIFEFIKA